MLWVWVWQFGDSPMQEERLLQNQNEETTIQFLLTVLAITYWNGNYSLSGVRSCSMNYFCIDCVVCMLETFFTLHNCSEHLEYCNLNPIVFLWCLKETQIILFFHNLFYYGNPMCLFHTKRVKITALWHCVSIWRTNLWFRKTSLQPIKKHFKTVFSSPWGAKD